MWQLCFCVLRVESPVAHGICSVAFLEIALHDDIVFCRHSFRHLVVWYVWNSAKQFPCLPLCLFHSLLHGFVLAFQHSHLSLNLLSLVLFALFHELSYLGSHLLTFLLCLV